ncbi:MAG: helix-turn-helix transcriptional regulator [Butyrivibrio sp.]|jgi:transcriptional regulator with XRE-family HTH domain|uniref:helix-turn-helix domain-containing protein n=1 Tax=Butyrivibrio sp. VCD2006 TaxID=1280664 RepID=UPI00040A311F|nr:helix-turn-helix transcriptional regulator [Butyrivibrio sp. VCD2006]MBE5844442.1 helix-turn-helix transcriptional regulator [Butyrivibrio sp.]MBR4342081.1 helix-turn-helix transcriptional regulator [Lachnospiraceae bacterium]
MVTIPAIDMAATGRNITKLRQDAGLSVKDLQMLFGFTTPQAIYKWQHGTAMPTIDNLVVLAVVFDVPIDDIIIVDNGVQAQVGA